MEKENINCSKPERLDLIKEIPVEICAVLGETTLPLKEIIGLAPGDVVSLDRLEGEPITLYANDCPLGQGEVVLINGKFGVRITGMSLGHYQP